MTVMQGVDVTVYSRDNFAVCFGDVVVGKKKRLGLHASPFLFSSNIVRPLLSFSSDIVLVVSGWIA